MCSHLVSFSLFTSFLIVSIADKVERRFLRRLCGAEDIGRHRLKTTYDDRFSTIQSCSPVADPPPPPFLLCIQNWGPKGRKIFGGTWQPLYLRVWMSESLPTPPPLPPSECLDPPLSVVSVVVSMTISQTIFSDTSLLHTEQNWYFIEKLGKSSTYSLLEGENPFPIGSDYISIGVIYFSSKEERRDHSISTTLLKGKTPVYPVSYHDKGFLTQFTVKEHRWVTVDAFQANWGIIHEGVYDPWRGFLRNIISSFLHWMVLDRNFPFWWRHLLTWQPKEKKFLRSGKFFLVWARSCPACLLIFHCLLWPCFVLYLARLWNFWIVNIAGALKIRH